MSLKLRHPTNFWKDHHNQIAFFDSLAKEHNITKPDEWSKIRIKDILNKGGSGLIKKHNNSLFASLEAVYHQISWDRDWFSYLPKEKRYPPNYWKNKSNQRKFFDDLGRKFKIEDVRDWGKINIYQIYENGGKGLLNHYYNGSLYKALISIYPNIEWEKNWFPNIFKNERVPTNFWKLKQNQISYFKELEKEFNIRIPSDWGKISISMIHQRGGKSLLHNYYGGSLLNALQSIYPNIPWMKQWFIHLPKYDSHYWNNLLHQRKFMNEFAIKYKILNSQDWNKISSTFFKSKGGNHLLKSYQGSLSSALRTLYPNQNWDFNSTLDVPLSKIQKEVYEVVRKLFPSFQIEINYRHPSKNFKFFVFINYRTFLCFSESGIRHFYSSIISGI